MRLAPPPPEVRLPWRPSHAPLMHALAFAASQVRSHEHALALALADDDAGAIDLPDASPAAVDLARLRAAGPLYFASELEAAGLMRCADLVAGLFASGAITQPLGPAAQTINTFWRKRRDRLEASEREAIFARVVEEPHFDRLMAALCRSIVAQADNAGDTGLRPDLHEAVGLSVDAGALSEFLAQRLDAMASLAVRDVIESINQALGFLRDRMVQAAFGTTSLWALVATAATPDGTAPGSAMQVQARVDRGRAGQAVLAWLATHAARQDIALNPLDAADVELMTMAQRWLGASPGSDLQRPAPARLLAA